MNPCIGCYLEIDIALKHQLKNVDCDLARGERNILTGF